MAWVFVLLRFVHATIHVTTNDVLRLAAGSVRRGGARRDVVDLHRPHPAGPAMTILTPGARLAAAIEVSPTSTRAAGPPPTR